MMVQGRCSILEGFCILCVTDYRVWLIGFGIKWAETGVYLDGAPWLFGLFLEGLGRRR